MAADSIVKARIDAGTKERASTALAAMGLSISDAIRLLMLRVAEEQRLPFDVQIPNASSRHEGIERGPWALFGVGRGSIQGSGHLSADACLVRKPLPPLRGKVARRADHARGIERSEMAP